MKTTTLRAVCCVLGSMFLGAVCPAATHYVSLTNSSSQEPYTNWATAGTDIVAVVQTAMNNPAPRVVVVGDGTYYPTSTIAITNIVRLESVNGRDSTILDGTLSGSKRGITLTAVEWYGVQTVSGFTLRNYTVTDLDGAALLCSSAAPIYVNLLNCAFLNNRSLFGSTTAWGGACAVALSRSAAPYPTLLVSNCVFRSNYSRNGGGGLYLLAIRGGVTFVDSLFQSNTGAVYGGGAVYFNGTVAERNMSVFDRCQVLNNRGGHAGGGLYFNDGITNVTLSSCRIEGNQTKFFATWAGSCVGGGISMHGRNSTIRDCEMVDNGARDFGGAVYASSPSLVNCLITGNSVNTNGGGLYLTGSGQIESCTVVSNSAGVSGGGLYATASTVVGTNSIIYFNGATVSAANFTNTAGNAGLNYCCVFPAVDGIGNITNDPLFVGTGTNKYTLRPTSLCVNAGVNKDWMTNAVDLAGGRRIWNGVVDMGAYETPLSSGTIITIK